MGLSTAQVAQLYRNSGQSVPKELEGAEEIRAHKYGAIAKEIDGHKFASTSEAQAYVILKLWERCGEISRLQLQPRFMLQDAFRDTNGSWRRAINYVADFGFYRDHIRTVIDIKGVETAVFKIKSKMFRQKYPDITLEIWDRDKVKELSRA